MMIKMTELQRFELTAHKIAWGALSILAGAALVGGVTTLQMVVVLGVAAPLRVYPIPLLVGGIGGLAIGSLFLGLKQRIRKLEIEPARSMWAEEAFRESEAYSQSLDALLPLMADNMPDLLWAKDMDRRYLFVNQALCDKLLLARDTDEPIGKDDMFFANRERQAHPDDPEWHTFGEICGDSDAVVMAKRRPQRFDEFGNVQGEFLYLDVYKAPIWDEQGKMVGTVGCGRIVTREKQIEEAVQQRKQYLVGLNEAAESLLVPADTIPFQEFVDRIGPASDASRAYVFINHRGPNGRLLMSQRAEWCAEGITPEIDNPLLQDLSYDEWLPRWRDTLMRGETINGRVADFPDKEREILEPQGIRAILVIPIMVDNEFDGFVGFDNCLSDSEWDAVAQTFLSAAASYLAQAIKRSRSEERVRASLKEKEVLLREIHHRVKNNMQVIVSLLRMHSRSLDDAQLGRVFEDCRDRVNAMSLIHEALYQSEDLARIDFEVYLRKLCRNLSQAHGASDKGIAVMVERCNVALDMDRGIAVGMVISELVSNAFKHAFPLGKGGSVSVSLSGLDEEEVELIIEDDGIGMRPETDILDPPSLGLQLAIATVTRELGGSIEVEQSGGTRFVIRFKSKST